MRRPSPTIDMTPPTSGPTWSAFADAVACRLRAARLWGRTVTLKVRFANRKTIYRSRKRFESPTRLGACDRSDRRCAC